MDEETKSDLAAKLRDEFLSSLQVVIFGDNFFETMADLKHLQTLKDELRNLPTTPDLKHIPQDIFNEVEGKIEHLIDERLDILDEASKTFYQEFDTIVEDVMMSVD